MNMKPARESDGAPTPRKASLTEAANVRPTQTEAARVQESKTVSYTHTPTKSFKEINGRRRQAQNAGAEHMKRAWHAEGSPRESDQGLTTPSTPWPSNDYMQQHAAQAPVRPRHCTQALLQQPDQVILSTLCRALRRERSSVSVSAGVCSASRFRVPAPAVARADARADARESTSYRGKYQSRER